MNKVSASFNKVCDQGVVEIGLSSSARAIDEEQLVCNATTLHGLHNGVECFSLAWIQPVKVVDQWLFLRFDICKALLVVFQEILEMHF